MKKYLIILIGMIILLVGCSNSLVHEELRLDLGQVIEKMDLAHEENRELNEDEEALLDRFYNKYITGQFSSNGENYEMNGIEKEVVRNVNSLQFYTKQDAVLPSEKSVYEKSKEEITELLELNSVPEELEDKHPTYEIQQGMNQRFKDESIDLFKELENLMIYNTLNERESLSLRVYLDKYDDIGFWTDGTHYLHTDETKEIMMVFWMIDKDIEEGEISSFAKSEYFRIKEKHGW